MDSSNDKPAYQIVLDAARTLPAPWTRADLAVAAYRLDPARFGMEGYPHPDAHRVYCWLFGKRGLIAKGLVRKIGGGRYECVTRNPVELTPVELWWEDESQCRHGLRTRECAHCHQTATAREPHSTPRSTTPHPGAAT